MCLKISCPTQIPSALVPGINNDQCLTWGREIDSNFGSVDSLPLKLNQLPSVSSDFYETLQGGSTSKYLQISHKRFLISTAQLKILSDFFNSQGKLEPLILTGAFSPTQNLRQVNIQIVTCWMSCLQTST